MVMVLAVKPKRAERQQKREKNKLKSSQIYFYGTVQTKWQKWSMTKATKIDISNI